MKNMQKTAKILDVIVHILQIVALVAAIACLVGSVIAGAGLLFGLPAETIGIGRTEVELEFLSLSLSDDAAPDARMILPLLLTEMLLATIAGCLAWEYARSLRRILRPVRDGLPFRQEVSKGLTRLAWLTVILGVFSNIILAVVQALTVKLYDFPSLFAGDKVLGVQINYEFDLSFLVMVLILFLLACVVRYGESLQQQVDETL